MSIEVTGITKTFGSFTALKNLSLKIDSGELLALLGPSGSGKTSLLRVIAGLDAPDSGSVIFDGDDISDRHAKDRNVGFVFQHYALFRHMTVFENIAFGLKVKPGHLRPAQKEIGEKVHELLRLVQLDWAAARFPSQLSGGQRQRVALARALAVRPKVLLLDEPFGSLDAKVRKELRQWLRRLHDEIHVTSIFVTHDQEEALEVADRVVIMNEGRIEQLGSPDEIYNHPASPFVYHFIGNVNLFHGRVEGDRAYIGNMVLDIQHPAQHDKDNAAVFIRPNQLDIERSPVAGNCFEAHVQHINPIGAFIKVDLLSEWGDPIHVEIPREKAAKLNLKKNDAVFVKPAELPSSDRSNYELQAGGGVSEPATRTGFTIWLTGLTGAGKSTLAYLLKKKLSAMGHRVELLDGDVIRKNISEGLSFSQQDRDANTLRIGFICHLLSRNGVINIVSATSPRRETRDQNRKLIYDFMEVYVKCPLEVCERRDAKGLYAAAREGRVKEMVGFDIPYEEPLHPEVVCETDKQSPEACIGKILEFLRSKGVLGRGASESDPKC